MTNGADARYDTRGDVGQMCGGDHKERCWVIPAVPRDASLIVNGQIAADDRDPGLLAGVAGRLGARRSATAHRRWADRPTVSAIDRA